MVRDARHKANRCPRASARSRWNDPACIIMLLIVAVTSHAHAVDVLERRGAEPMLTGEVTIIDDNGVTLRSETGATHTVPWDRIRDLRTAVVDPTLPRRLETAEQLWRGRTRLERGDAYLAEPLFERLFEQYRGRTHETALVVAEGLLRCRLTRLDHARAVIPALEVLRLTRAGVQTDSYASLPDLFDDEYELCMPLTPAWINARQVAVLERALGSYDAGGDAVVAAMALEYRRSARLHLDLSITDEPTMVRDAAVDHAGVALLRLIVDATTIETEDARAAQRRLEQRLPALPEWARGWAHYTLGVAQIADDNIDQRLRGLVHLLHLPAGGPETHLQYLTGLALHDAARGLEAIGRHDAAESLRLELARQHPGHPVLEHQQTAQPGDA